MIFLLLILLASPLLAAGNPEITDKDISTKFGRERLAPIDSRSPDVVRSSFTNRSYEGYMIGVASGAIAANTTITIGTGTMKAQYLGTPVCGELESVNTAGVSVRVKSLAGLPNSFTVYNADIVNEKNFTCMFPMKR